MTRLFQVERLVLGSISPFRGELLGSIGVSFIQKASSLNESDIVAPDPKELALLRSAHKGLKMEEIEENSIVISADQVLDFEGQGIGKVQSIEEAEQRLQSLVGKTHFLHSAYSFVLYHRELDFKPVELLTEVDSSTLKMKNLSQEEIAGYLATGEWKGCAGCYQFENRGRLLFEKVEGDQASIVGLPLNAIIQDFSSIGVNLLLNPKGPWKIKVASFSE